LRRQQSKQGVVPSEACCICGGGKHVEAYTYEDLKVARKNARTATQILAGQMMRGIVARSITLLTVKIVEHLRLIMGRMARLRMKYAADALREILLEHLLVLLPMLPVLVPA
jgi:hypothetical protein